MAIWHIYDKRTIYYQQHVHELQFNFKMSHCKQKFKCKSPYFLLLHLNQDLMLTHIIFIHYYPSNIFTSLNLKGNKIHILFL